jgi:hypothetical protein
VVEDQPYQSLKMQMVLITSSPKSKFKLIEPTSSYPMLIGLVGREAKVPQQGTVSRVQARVESALNQ